MSMSALVLEPIYEADFQPCSYGFRPKRRAQDAIAEIHFLASATRNYCWVLEADIKACFDEIDHTALLRRVRHRIADKRVLGLVKGFLKAGVLAEDGTERDTITGTPQGGILSPLLANIALSVLDDQSSSPPRHPLDAENLRHEVATVLAPMGLHLSEDKTRVCHIDEGFDFLGFRIQRHRKRGTNKSCVYTYPSKKALASIKAKVRTMTRGATNLPLAVLCYRLAPVLRGWTNYFRHGVSKSTFDYVREFTWRRVICWLRHKHPTPTGSGSDGATSPGGGQQMVRWCCSTSAK